MCKKSRFTLYFHKLYGKRAQALLKSSSQQFYHIQWSQPRILNWKKSLLLTCQILGLLVHTLAANGKYPLLNRDILMIPSRMLLTHKQKNFSEFFAEFLKSRLNFEHFEDKNDPQKFWIS